MSFETKLEILRILIIAERYLHSLPTAIFRRFDFKVAEYGHRLVINSDFNREILRICRIKKIEHKSRIGFSRDSHTRTAHTVTAACNGSGQRIHAVVILRSNA